MKNIFIRLLLVASALSVVFLIGAQIATAANNNVMIISAHEDDETIACSAVIKRAIENGDDVKILMVTTGDWGDPRVRIQKTIDAMAVLGLASSNIIYLGYGNHDVLDNAYTSKDDPQRVFPGVWGTETYGFPDIGITDYHYIKHGVHAPYNRESILNDIYEVINEYLPDQIYMPSHMETHPDHSSSALLATEAILVIKTTQSYSPDIHEYMIYRNGLPQDNLNALEPCDNTTANMNETPYDWASRESIPVPDEMYYTLQSGLNLKCQAFDAYLGDVEDYKRFIKSDEIFWKKHLSSLSYSAEVSASSEDPITGQYCKSGIDGVILGYPYSNDSFSFYDKEWATVYQTTGAWLQLSWPSMIEANRIVLYDRPNLTEQVLSGTLAFSDGTSIQVSALPNNGSGHVIDFNTKTFSWVKFTINQASGYNIGLSEFEVYNTIGNVAPESTVSVSSHNVNTSQLGSKATDNVINGWPADYTKEWATEGQTVGAWIKLSWQQNYNISSIVLYDRPNLDDHISSGTLAFSDGSSMSVGSLPNDGTAEVINLPSTKTINWITFTFDEAEGSNIGLSEFEVYGYPQNSSYSNIAPISRVSASSEETNYSLSQAAIKAVDGQKAGYPYDYNSEWATVAERNGAWIKLDWERDYSINKIVLYDRPNLDDHITDATLFFSNGTSCSVGELPNNGEGKIIQLPDFQTIKSVKLVVNNADGWNTGLAEFEVYGTAVN